MKHLVSMKRVYRGFLASLICVLFAACSAPAAELLDSPLIQAMQRGQEQGNATFDHAPFDELLRAHVDLEKRRVNYAAFKNDEARLDAYLKTIANADVTSLDADEQHALLINAYNAYTIKLILENYPGIQSIRDIPNPWKTERYTVATYTLSLDNIEHNIIRPMFKDPRIHFAVNCAAKDCPPLRPWAYTGDALHNQLDEVTRDVLSSPNFVKVANDELHVTKLFEWYEDDFINSSFNGYAPNIAQYIAQYTSAEIRNFITSKDNNPRVVSMNYDWALNDTTN